MQNNSEDQEAGAEKSERKSKSQIIEIEMGYAYALLRLMKCVTLPLDCHSLRLSSRECVTCLPKIYNVLSQNPTFHFSLHIILFMALAFIFSRFRLFPHIFPTVTFLIACTQKM